MDQNKTPNSEMNGFDSTEKGYTVTPDGGFYTAGPAHAPAEPASESAPAPAETEPNFIILSDTPYEEAPTEEPPKREEPTAVEPPPAVRKKEKRGVSVAVVIVSVLLAAVIGAASGIGAMYMLGYRDDTAPPTQSEAQTGDIVNTTINVEKVADSAIEAVAEKAGPSVVGIRTTLAVTNFFGGSEDYTGGEGSGIIYSSDGYIITNYHVLESAIESASKSKIEVFVNDDSENSYAAEVVGYNISNDLAVLKIEATGLTAIEIGDSDTLKRGQPVAAIGCPGGLNFIGSVSSGIISGLNRSMNSSNKNTVSLIQTDAAINPGNSGGALLDINGRLIGVNSSKIASTEYEGMGFAIPVNTVVEICDDIITHKDDPSPYIGITLSETYSRQTLMYLGFPAGAVVLSVDEDSPADKSGIRRGDIITEFAGIELNDYSEFGSIINDCKIGDTVKVKLYRSGRYYTTELTITSNSAQ